MVSLVSRFGYLNFICQKLNKTMFKVDQFCFSFKTIGPSFFDILKFQSFGSSKLSTIDIVITNVQKLESTFLSCLLVRIITLETARFPNLWTFSFSLSTQFPQRRKPQICQFYGNQLIKNMHQNLKQFIFRIYTV